MITRERLMPVGRLVHLNNESRIAKAHLEGLETTHQVIGHKGKSIVFKSVNGNRVREISNLDIHYFIPNNDGGWTGRVLECRDSKKADFIR